MTGTRDVDALLNKWRTIEEGTFEPERPPPSDPGRVPLFGGISGLTLSIPEFELCEGLVVRETYAHVMAPYIMAFGKPKRPGAPHPPPWKPAHGGLGFDVTIEVALSKASQPTGLNRLNTLWWVLALLRLVTGAPIRMPVVSDMAFAAVPLGEREPNLWTIEMPPRQLRIARSITNEISSEQLQWVQNVFLEGARLLDNEAFNRAFQTFDSAIWAHSSSSAIIMAWAALETIFRPGRTQITKTLAMCLATFLHSTGPERDRAYQKITGLYEVRGGATHDAQAPEAEKLLDTFDLARRCLTKCLETRQIPNADELIKQWKERR